MSRYFKNLLIAADQGVNTVFGGNPDETISSRVGRGALKGDRLALYLERIIDGFFWIIRRELNHCRNRIEWNTVPNKDY